MSKVGPAVNGDIMVGSMDSRAMRSRNLLNDDWNEKSAKMFNPEVDHMYASVNDVQNRDREVVQLKRMLQVNLDLIQTQSETLQAKDKEIAALREENNALRLRNQRMERRVTLKRTKDEPVGNTEPTTGNSEPVAAVSLAEDVNVNTIKKRRASGGSASRRKIRTISGGSDRTKRSASNSESNDTERKNKPRPQLTSDREYYTGSDEVWSPVDLVAAPDEVNEAQVQVPSWREKNFTPLYVIEGTENVEEDVFLKRHQKLECDERRRKRWDIQRIREQTQLERLKQRGEKRKMPHRSPERPVASFFPLPEDLQEVAVGPQLPVLAFGLPLRTYEPCEFSLLWNATSGQKLSNLRQR